MAPNSFRSQILDLVPFDHPLKLVAYALGVVSMFALFQYRGAINKRLQILREESLLFSAGVTMERVLDSDSNVMQNGVFQNLHLLELNPEFKRKSEEEGWKLLTLGDYMSQLRPKGLPKRIAMDDAPKVVQREMEAGLAAGLLKAFGPHLGRAMLPAVGTGFVDKKAKSLTSKIFTNWFMSPHGYISESNDKAGIPIGVMPLLTLADANAKIKSSNDVDDIDDDPHTKTTSMEKMILGEVVKGPSFMDQESAALIPNDFVVETDFERAIKGMESRLMRSNDDGGIASTAMKMAQEDVMAQEMSVKDQQEGKKVKLPSEPYDPECRRMAEPVPINPRLFPDLHMGFGGALCSHTKREGLKIRLLALLLNKLGSNYYKQARKSSEPLFSIRMSESDRPIYTPGDFIQALIDSGHEVKVVPSSHATTFGIGMCVKEMDGSWTTVPLAVFLESGYEDRNGQMAPVMLPHSALDMHVSGPIAGERGDGTPSQLALGHFIGIDGYCGWYTNANPEVPFREAVYANEYLQGKDAIRAARVAGLVANVLNGLATQLDLPFGGYGLTAVCNDSAAVVQQVLYNENTIYPLTSIGRFAQATIRYAQGLRDDLKSIDGMEKEVDELCHIIKAMRKLPSDINASPANAQSAARRMRHTLPSKLPFLLMCDAKNVVDSILAEEASNEKEAASVENTYTMTGVGDR